MQDPITNDKNQHRNNQYKNVDYAEVEKFAEVSEQWWNPDSAFGLLHKMMPTRMSYICEQLKKHFGGVNSKNTKRPLDVEGTTLPLQNMRIVDVGCGGGLVCEGMANLGGSVIGYDLDSQALDIAREHAALSNLDITYCQGTVTEAADIAKAKGQKADIVLALEIIEHVPDPEEFVYDCLSLLKPDGLVIFSTQNRTLQSLLLAIVAGEYILGWIPRGTHDWRRFVRPSELSHMIQQAQGHVEDISGMPFHPLKQSFDLSEDDLSVSYFISASKTPPQKDSDK